MILSAGKTLNLPDLLGFAHHGRAVEKVQNGDDIQDAERVHIVQVLDKCGWKIKGPGNAAELLGLKPSTLRSRMKKLNITRPHATHEPATCNRREISTVLATGLLRQDASECDESCKLAKIQDCDNML